MLKDLHTLSPYLDFIHDCSADPDYRDPMLLTEQQLHRNLLDAPENPNTRVLGTFENDTVTGVFALLVPEDEKYLELLAGLSRSAVAYDELLAHLKSAYPGYQADFVYNPRNRLLQKALEALGAEFEPEQQKLVLRRTVPYVPDARIVPYRPEYRAQYLALQNQINPHFFMNTLNNIHALVDMDAGKAKRTIVELSKLMRYVLYEASNRTILLSREIQFLDNYIALMKLRYTGRVRIECCMPDEVPEVQIPPLLFISFVENAFKHGVSYQEESFIWVFMSVEDGRLAFRCSNSNHGRSVEQHHGIGLENIRKRLRLLFGQDYTLSINERDDSFNVLLIIPLL